LEFRNILGENASTQILKQAIETGKIHHAHLLSGPEGSGKMACALEAAMALLCKVREQSPCGQCSSCKKILNYNHPDFRIVFPFVSKDSFKDVAKKLGLKQLFEQETGDKIIYDDIFFQYITNSTLDLIRHPFQRPRLSEDLKGKNRLISVEQVRDMIASLHLPPSESEYKIVIIPDADMMNAEAANTLLKTLEEPFSYVKFFLVTARPHALLPTVRSRCQQLKFNELGSDQLKSFLLKYKKASKKKADAAARLSLGSIQNALDFLEASNDQIMEDALDIIECVAEGDLKKAFALAERYAKSPFEENQKRLKMTATLVREMDFFQRQGKRPDGMEGLTQRLTDISGKIEPGLFSNMFDKIVTALYALEKRGRPRHVYAALLLSLV
jgi:DNA polymerase-3 subunit delta'